MCEGNPNVCESARVVESPSVHNKNSVAADKHTMDENNQPYSKNNIREKRAQPTREIAASRRTVADTVAL
jgi:hypothetical protein